MNILIKHVMFQFEEDPRQNFFNVLNYNDY